MYKWVMLAGGAVLGGLVWLGETTHVRVVLTGPPPGDLAGLGLSQEAPSGGLFPVDLALWGFLAVAALVLLAAAVRARVSRATFRPDPAAPADRTPSTGDTTRR